jgi:hypothetical protein
MYTVQLEREQVELLAAIVEASRAVTRDRRMFFQSSS